MVVFIVIRVNKCPITRMEKCRGQFRRRKRYNSLRDKASRIFKHLQNSEHCRVLCYVDYSHVLGHASTSF